MVGSIIKFLFTSMIIHWLHVDLNKIIEYLINNRRLYLVAENVNDVDVVKYNGITNFLKNLK